MSHHEHVDPGSKPGGNFFTSRSGLVLIGFLAIAGFFLFTEHRAHLVGYWPFLLLLLCPLLHMFHGGHGGHTDHDAEGSSQREPGTGKSGT
jgi:hypothetical protein